MKKAAIDGLIHRVTRPVDRPVVLRSGVVLVYGWLAAYALLLWGESSYIWGPTAVLQRYGAPSTVIQNQIYGVLYFPGRFPWIYGLHIAAALSGMANLRWAAVPRAVAWLTGLMLYYAAIPAHNSGMLLILLLAFYLIPVYTRTESPYRHALNHTALWAVMLQVLLCYTFSAIYKFMGLQWISGDALYYALHIERFSQPWILESPAWAQSTLWNVLTWGALLYQVAFPVVVLAMPRKRLWFLLIGVAMHLFIATVMNLWDFGTAMIVCYAFFLPEPKKGDCILIKFVRLNSFRFH